jgi:hypothetical protein
MVVMMKLCCNVGNGVYSDDLWRQRFFVALEMATCDVNNRNDVGCKVFLTTCKEHVGNMFGFT